MLKKLWKDTEDAYIGGKGYFFLTPSHYSIYHDFSRFFRPGINGLTVDLGAGRLGWKPIVEKAAKKYLSADISLNGKALDMVADGSKLALRLESVDTLLCMQVIEHTRDPRAILFEASRVLKKGGRAIVSFPHLSYLHGEPEDYFRFTIHGFRSLLPDGLVIEEARASGGLLCFALTPAFIFLNAAAHKVPIAGKCVYYILSLASVVVFHADRFLGMRRLYPLNYICGLKKT